MDTSADPAAASYSLSLPAGVTDIDRLDAQDPQMVAEYVPEITAYMRKLEVEQAVVANYMQGVQTAIKPEMRSVLVDWLVEVHLRFKLIPETLQLTVNIMDRYLAKCPTEKSKLQLVGVTAMLIASKYEEMYPPEVRDFVWIADNTYTRGEIISLEGVMLRELDYDLGTPLPVHFLNRGIKACSADKTTETMATYFCELSLVGYEMAHFLPSEKAAASLCLARAVMTQSTSEKAWAPNLAHFMGFAFAEMKPCLDKLTDTVAKVSKSKHQAVRTKFGRSKFEAVAANEQLVTHKWM
jgi:cyclin B